MRFLLIVSIILLPFASGARVCTSNFSPIELVAFNETLGSAVVLHQETLRNQTGEATLVHSMREGVTIGNLTYKPMRSCPCRRDDFDLYCPLEAHLCFVEHADDSPRGWCETGDKRVAFVQNSWPFIMLWNLMVLVGMVTSRQGRNALLYPIHFCFPSINRKLTYWMIEHHPDRANAYLRNYHRRNRHLNPGEAPVIPFGFDLNAMMDGVLNVSEVSTNKPTSLLLKTKVYDAPDEVIKSDQDVFDDDGGTVSCTICFVPLVKGDRVGDIPCKHVFHVDCLKVWLRRRVVCPLCQRSDVADPKYDRGETEEDPQNDEI